MVFNQSPADVQGLRVRVRVYDLNGKVLDDRSADGIQVPFNGATQVMALPRYPQSTPVFFVRCQLFDSAGKLLADNTYWQSQKDDDMGDRKNDSAFDLKQDSWADMTALNTMAPVQLELSAHQTRPRVATSRSLSGCIIRPNTSPSSNGRPSPLHRTETRSSPSVTTTTTSPCIPAKLLEIHATLSKSAEARWIRLEGYNTPATSAQIE